MKDITMTSVFTDDHIMCANVTITNDDGTKENDCLMWVGWEGCAAIKYWADSNEAKETVARLLAERDE